MNDLFIAWGVSGLKPWLEGLLLSPLPLFAIALAGAFLLRRRPRAGWTALLAGLIGLWAISTTALGSALIDALTRPPAALQEHQVASLSAAPRTAIVVLGAGRRLLAPECGGADLKPMTIERLRFGVWLARRTGLPLAYSGGLSYNAPPGPTEAEIANKVASREFGVALRWVEDKSHDTAENAAFSVALLHAAGIERIVIVTNGFHQRRARAAFERAATRQGVSMALVSASVDSPASRDLDLGDFLPGAEGLNLSMLALHEWVGWLAGA